MFRKLVFGHDLGRWQNAEGARLRRASWGAGYIFLNWACEPLTYKWQGFRTSCVHNRLGSTPHERTKRFIFQVFSCSIYYIDTSLERWRACPVRFVYYVFRQQMFCDSDWEEDKWKNLLAASHKLPRRNVDLRTLRFKGFDLTWENFLYRRFFSSITLRSKFAWKLRTYNLKFNQGHVFLRFFLFHWFWFKIDRKKGKKSLWY